MKQMLQIASNDIFNQLFPNAHNNERQNLLFPLQIKQLKVNLKLNWRIFIFAPSALMGEDNCKRVKQCMETVEVGGAKAANLFDSHLIKHLVVQRVIFSRSYSAWGRIRKSGCNVLKEGQH